MHAVDGRLVGGLLVAAADPARAAQRGRLGHAHELQREVAVGGDAHGGGPYTVRRMPRWGLTVPFAGVPLRETELLVRRAEAAGYDDLWAAETNGPDGFTPLALAAAWTERMRLGTGVVNAFTRGPAVLAQHAAALADATGGRFVLGLGSSSNVIVERWNEIRSRGR